MKYVIIGNSAAAVGAIEGIRQADKDGGILVLSNEPHHTYSRPLISYLLYGKTDLEKMKYRKNDFYAKNNCETRLGVKVTAIDSSKKTVKTESGEEISYEKLLVATGSRPFVPPMEGLATVKDSFTFMTLDDANALSKVLNKDKRVLIVGAGLIGLKCAEGIQDKVKSITVVDIANRILPSILDEKGSAIVMEHIQKSGVVFKLSTGVQKFEGKVAQLSNGESIDFDILVLAVGVRPNTELVKDAGGKVNRGILTDKTLLTSLKDVYAAGDCTESFDITVEQSRILALLPNAYMQGECAGINMAGGNKPYLKAVPMNAIGFFGLHMITAGSYDGEAYTVSEGQNYKKLITKDGLFKGYILIGDISRAGIYTSLIREKTPLNTIDFELIKQKPQLMAFAKKDRSKILAKEGGSL